MSWGWGVEWGGGGERCHSIGYLQGKQICCVNFGRCIIESLDLIDCCGS